MKHIISADDVKEKLLSAQPRYLDILKVEEVVDIEVLVKLEDGTFHWVALGHITSDPQPGLFQALKNSKR